MKNTKKIAIDARFYYKAGPGRYIKNILENLEKIDKNNIYYIFLTDEGYQQYTPQNPNFIKIKANYSWYSFKEQTLFLLKILKYNPNLLYVPHFNIPILFPKKIVTAIPDIIMHTFSTEKGTTLPKPYFKFKKFIYKLVTKLAVRKSKFIVVPSYTTLNDIKKTFKVNDSKLVYAPEGVDSVINPINILFQTDILKEFGIKKPYALYVGSMYEHKNIEKLIEAFDNLRKHNPDFDLNLVLAGKKDKFSLRIQHIIFEKNLQNRIFMPGEIAAINDTQMNTLRKYCEFYVFPSLKEGFSLTPLEAMVFDKACVISDIDCHREIYQDSVMYFDPNEINDIADKIFQVHASEELRNIYAQKGKECLKKYNWEQTAQITLQTFNAVFNNS